MVVLLLMVTMFKLIPNIKVNYTLYDIFRAIFISSKNTKYTLVLERKLRELYNVNEVMLTSSGRSALFFILKNLPQSKVIIPAYTCDVVVEAAMLAGKHVVYAHIKKETLDFADISMVDSDCIVIAKHQYGFHCDIIKICSICKSVGAVVIEDCAGAFYTSLGGQLAGSFGDFAIFSFNASKLLNAPTKGGFIIAKDDNNIVNLKKNINFYSCNLEYKFKNLFKGFAFCLDKNSRIHFFISLIRNRANKSNKQNVRKHISSTSYKPNENKMHSYYYGFYSWQAFAIIRQLDNMSKILLKRKFIMDKYGKMLVLGRVKDSFARNLSCIRYPILLEDRDKIMIQCKKNGIELGVGFEHFICPDNYYDEIDLSHKITYLPYGSTFSSKEILYCFNYLNSQKYV